VPHVLKHAFLLGVIGVAASKSNDRSSNDGSLKMEAVESMRRRGIRGAESTFSSALAHVFERNGSLGHESLLLLEDVAL
jgi:hypothetical protein